MPNADAQEVLSADDGIGESLEPQLTFTTVKPGSIHQQKSVREAGTLVQAHRNVPHSLVRPLFSLGRAPHEFNQLSRRVDHRLPDTDPALPGCVPILTEYDLSSSVTGPLEMMRSNRRPARTLQRS